MKSKLLLLFGLSILGCTNNDINKQFDCATSDLAITLLAKTNTSNCKAIDGKLTVSAAGGDAPYDFSLNGGIYQTNNEFLNLGPGSYAVVAKDANGCKASLQIEISAFNSTLDASIAVVKNTQCNTPNGSITITASGGIAPYSYLSGTGGFTPNNLFSGLKGGIYNIIVKDANDCQKTVSVTVPRDNTNTSYINQIQPILATSCNLPSCHGAGTGARDWTNFQNLKTNANNVKTRTGNRSMPINPGPALTQSQIDLIACWVDDGAANN